MSHVDQLDLTTHSTSLSSMMPHHSTKEAEHADQDTHMLLQATQAHNKLTELIWEKQCWAVSATAGTASSYTDVQPSSIWDIANASCSG